MSKRSAFFLFSTIVLIVLLSIYSLNILKNNSLFYNINNHKYLHLQALSYMKKAKTFILSNDDFSISNYSLNDSRYNFKITKKQLNEDLYYFVSIETADETNIRVYEKIKK